MFAKQYAAQIHYCKNMVVSILELLLIVWTVSGAVLFYCFLSHVKKNIRAHVLIGGLQNAAGDFSRNPLFFSLFQVPHVIVKFYFTIINGNLI